jgi:ribosomal protein L36
VYNNRHFDIDSFTETRYITGKRQYTTFLYEYDSFPKNLIAPATFLWRQDPHSENTIEVDELSKQGQLWVWVHPSAFEVTKTTIQDTISKTNKADLVNVKDMENSLVMFDFTGPRSTALLKAVLQLCQSPAASPYQEAHKVLQLLFLEACRYGECIRRTSADQVFTLCGIIFRHGRLFVICGRHPHSLQALFLASSPKILDSRRFMKI